LLFSGLLRNAVPSLGPIAEVDQLAALAAEGAERITLELRRLSAPRAGNDHGAGALLCGRHDGPDQVVLERAVDAHPVEPGGLDLPDLRVVDEADTVDLWRLRLEPGLQ